MSELFATPAAVKSNFFLSYPTGPCIPNKNFRPLKRAWRIPQYKFSIPQWMLTSHCEFFPPRRRSIWHHFFFNLHSSTFPFAGKSRPPAYHLPFLLIKPFRHSSFREPILPQFWCLLPAGILPINAPGSTFLNWVRSNSTDRTLGFFAELSQGTGPA